MSRRTIKVDTLARVEGEGAMDIRITGDKVKDVKLRIYEPPRFFEAFLRGRMYSEAPDITARICGICPIAYMMSSVHAMEDIFGVTVGGPLRELRRLIYCGEWIESHALHIYLLHAPDFLGYESAVHMAKDYADVVKKGLRLKKAGNDIVRLVGGREIHPINVRVGGFYSVPSKAALGALRDELLWACDASEETVRWAAELPFPDFERDYEFVALQHPDEYPFNEGRLVSNKGLDIPISDFHEHIEEYHVEHSTSLHSRLRARGEYFVGPQARWALNYDKLTPRVKSLAEELGLGGITRNPFKSILIRGLETLYACEEAVRVIDAYEEPDAPYAAYEVKAGTGYGCTEAPRGICHHVYSVDGEGHITFARIAPPTAQNQPVIESDLRAYATKFMDLSNDDLQWQCEQAIRNYDPCISCSCHFLRVRVIREA